MYYYDENGTPIAMQYRDSTKASNVWDKYIFEKNLQGDVVAIYSTSGTKLVSYTYDAWGNVSISYHNGGASTSATYNRLTYRGYYYDTDLQLYYLQNRYYDAKVGRFINADGYVATGQGLLGNNMFAYCGNNPVNRVDPTGQFWGGIWTFVKAAAMEIGSAIKSMSPAYAGVGSAALIDGVLPVGDAVAIAGFAILTLGAVGYGIYRATERNSRSATKDKAAVEPQVIPATLGNSVVFPADPNAFNPVGLNRVHRAGTKNGAFISWMDPVTNVEVFRWDENINYSNGPHYHIHGTGHYYAGTVVPEPYATIYFPS